MIVEDSQSGEDIHLVSGDLNFNDEKKSLRYFLALDKGKYYFVYMANDGRYVRSSGPTVKLLYLIDRNKADISDDVYKALVGYAVLEEL